MLSCTETWGLFDIWLVDEDRGMYTLREERWEIEK